MDVRSRISQNRAEIFAAPKFQSAFALLLDSSIYAAHTGNGPWEYAVSARQLAQVGLSENDLRFLIRLEYVEHARETTAAGSMNRQFRSPSEPSMTMHTCFVLTRKGQEAASQSLTMRRSSADNGRATIRISQSTHPTPKTALPRWDSHRRILWFDDQVVKHFRWHAGNQELILTTFQEENWPIRILDPLAPAPEQVVKRRLSDTIKCLNRGQENALIHFRGDGTGEGVVWEVAG